MISGVGQVSTSRDMSLRVKVDYWQGPGEPSLNHPLLAEARLGSLEGAASPWIYITMGLV